MKKKALIALVVVLLLCAGALNVSAQVRLEGNLSWPVLGGIKLDSSIYGSSGSSVDLSQYHLLLPDFRIYYQFGDGILRGGIGARVYSLIIESIIYPEAFIEVELTPIVLEASLGGYVFGVFGLYNNVTTAQLMIPDLNVGWAIAPWFRLGAGVLMFAPLNGNWSQNFGYIGYIGARFIFVLK